MTQSESRVFRIHAPTLGGNPISCQAAMATIELLEKSYPVICKDQVGYYILDTRLRGYDRMLRPYRHSREGGNPVL